MADLAVPQCGNYGGLLSSISDENSVKSQTDNSLPLPVNQFHEICLRDCRIIP